jgi:hypothetical protein
MSAAEPLLAGWYRVSPARRLHLELTLGGTPGAD